MDNPLVYAIANKVPEWQCHKRVHAAKIVDIKSQDEVEEIARGEFPGLCLYLEGIEAPLTVHHSWAGKQGAVLDVGNYLVFYDDGHLSVGPSPAFELGYLPMPTDGSSKAWVMLDIAMAHLYQELPATWPMIEHALRERYAELYNGEPLLGGGE